MSFAEEIIAVNQMPFGEARTAAAESVVRRIEAEGERDVLAWGLSELVEAYTFAGNSDRAFVAFARMLRLWDESPELFDQSDTFNLFWEYKWIADGVCEFPQISCDQAEEFFVDMERRYRLEGLGLSAVRVSRFNWAWRAGAPDAEDLRQAWRSTPSDEFDDCAACVIGTQVAFLLEHGRYEECLALGATQRDSCNIEPTKTHHALALAELLNGDSAAALRHHRLALATFEGKTRELAPSRGQCFELLARGGQIERALRSLRNEDASLLEQASSPLDRLLFLLGVLAGLSANEDRADLETGLTGSGRETLGGLHAWVLAAVTKIAAGFDERNGNAHYRERVAHALGATLAKDALDFSVQTGAAAAETGTTGAKQSGGGTGTAGVAEQRSDAQAIGGAAVAAPGERVARDDESAQQAGALSPAAALLAQAETLAGGKDYAAASLRYSEAAALLEAAGLLDQAGLAYAEAAQCAGLVGDEDGAHASFELALPRLVAGSADDGVTLQVVQAWAPLAARMGDLSALLGALADLTSRLGAPVDTTGLSEALAKRRIAEQRLGLAHAQDLLARCLASAERADIPEQLRETDVVGIATAAAEGFVEFARVSDAAHAYWLAARLQRDAGDAVGAIASYEAALEGQRFGRDAQAKAEATGELIALFRQCGLDEQAELLIAGQGGGPAK